jgi:ParB family transcriptional regulator, chromosome partitioning protein
LDLARFIRACVDAGDSNATIAKRLGIDQTTIAHHLALLELPPELNEAMQAGRCTSPRTLYELAKLHSDEPERPRALLAGDGDIHPQQRERGSHPVHLDRARVNPTTSTTAAARASRSGLCTARTRAGSGREGGASRRRA